MAIRRSPGKRKFSINFVNGDWVGLKRFLEQLNELLHQTAGIGQDTVGTGTTIKNRKWPEANINRAGVMGVHDYRAFLGVYDHNTDSSTTANTVYVGYAVAGTLSSASAWQIRRVVSVNDEYIEEFADGDLLFDNVWNNRASLSYKSIDEINV